MNLVSLIAIAVALAMDAFAVAVATGVNLKSVSLRQTFRLSWHFGLFQALMPVIGWFCGTAVQGYVQNFAHWIAFIVLFLVGGNMLKGALGKDDEDKKAGKDATKGMTMVMLSIATSIDALAVGVSMSLLQIKILTPALVIGIVAGIFTIAGLHLGKMAAQIKKLSPVAEIAGGLILWLIGLNILWENGVFS